MIRDFTTTIVVIVHGWQVIVNHRVGMNVFQSTRCWQNPFSIATDGLRSSQRENRPEAFPPGKHAVAHRLHEEGRITVGSRKALIQAHFNALPLLLEIVLQRLHSMAVSRLGGSVRLSITVCRLITQ